MRPWYSRDVGIGSPYGRLPVGVARHSHMCGQKSNQLRQFISGERGKQRSERTHEEVRAALDQASLNRPRCCRWFHREGRAVSLPIGGPLRRPCLRFLRNDGNKVRQFSARPRVVDGNRVESLKAVGSLPVSYAEPSEKFSEGDTGVKVVVQG